MKKMIYKKLRSPEVLDIGTYRGCKYAIISLGSHPCAYVENIKQYSNYEVANEKIGFLVHGGFTYCDEAYWVNDSYNYLGWDYAHPGDYYHNESNLFFSSGKRWTTLEIFQDVKKVIDLWKKPEVK